MTTDYISVSLSDIELRIHIFGFSPMGECVLVLIYNKAKSIVIRSILFDCFENSKSKQLTLCLDDYKLDKRKLDFVIWTHPDTDHSVGLKDIIERYTSKETIFILPDGMSIWWFLKRIFHNRSLNVSSMKEIIKPWIMLKRLSKKGYSVERVNVSNNRSLTTYCNFDLIELDTQIHCNLEIVTPFASDVFRKTEANTTTKGNDISISAILHIDEYGFYFGGDAENEALSKIDKNRFSNLKFVKIPHHASMSSSKLPDIIQEVINDNIVDVDGYGDFYSPDLIALTTCFYKGRSKLPQYKVLESYKKCASKIVITEDKTHNNLGYGISQSFFKLYPFQLIESKEIADASVFQV